MGPIARATQGIRPRWPGRCDTAEVKKKSAPAGLWQGPHRPGYPRWPGRRSLVPMARLGCNENPARPPAQADSGELLSPRPNIEFTRPRRVTCFHDPRELVTEPPEAQP